MGLGWYGKWMTRWETDLTTRDTNRIVRPLEWGFDWLADFGDAARAHGAVDHVTSAAEAALSDVRRNGTDESVPLSKTASAVLAPMEDSADLGDLDRMIALNLEIARGSDEFFGYVTPTDF